MATITFGEVSWDEELPKSNGKRDDYKDLFMRLEKGSNDMRIITNPHQYLMHKMKKDPTNPKDFGVKVLCSQAHGKCPLCETGDKAKPRWLFGIIDRKTNAYKILDVSYSVYSQLKTLTKSPKWGPLVHSYDIDVVMNPDASPQDYYRVLPSGKSPLSADDQKLRDNADLEDLKRRVTPPTYDQVEQRIQKILGTTLKPGPTKAVDVSGTDDEFEFSEAN